MPEGQRWRGVIRRVAIALVCGWLAHDLLAVPSAEARTRHRRHYTRSRTTPYVRSTALAALFPDAARDTTRATLEAIVDRAATEAGGVAGVAIVHLETGERVVRAPDERFPMASTYKVAIALRLLQRVDAGEISLGDTVLLRRSDLRTGSGRISARHPNGGRMTLLELFRAMLTESDNSASDFLLRVAGGPGAVTARVHDLGARELRVDRPEVRMAFDYYGLTSTPPESTWTTAVLSKLMNGSPYPVRKQAAADFLLDPRDTTTPVAMTDLLARLSSGAALSAASTTLLLDTMEQCETGPGRIPAYLPAGVRVAHKTGTWSSTDGITAALNDVGILTLPGNGGHVAIAMFVKGSRRSNGRIERCIARVARAAYDHWAPFPAAAETVVPNFAAQMPVPAEAAAESTASGH